MNDDDVDVDMIRTIAEAALRIREIMEMQGRRPPMEPSPPTGNKRMDERVEMVRAYMGTRH